MKRFAILFGFWAAVISVFYVGVVKADASETPKRQVLPHEGKVYHHPQPRGALLQGGYKNPVSPSVGNYLYTTKPSPKPAYHW